MGLKFAATRSIRLAMKGIKVLYSLKGELKSKNHVCFYYFIWKLWTYKIKFWQLFSLATCYFRKNGFEIGIFPLFGLCHCGLATDVSGML